ncbi:hypothetical protein ABKV19_004441 [Rosa sericea]
MQVEKAARESEAEAIRKILGQDSSRKKKEDKIKKRQEDLAQERAANAMLPSDSVRWVMGPSGSIVTFPDTIGLPTIFDSKPCRYSSILKSTGLLSDASLGSWIKYFSMFNY